jgi:2-polyprenyl-6-methoxyphenol hydroxylase-like FAD-dependent oxidoreductase
MQEEVGLGTLGDAGSVERVHIVGAGPIGLMLTALLQPLDGVSVRLYEKRREYTRKRMVGLAPYLAADSVDSYRAGNFDGENLEAVFAPTELDDIVAIRHRIPSDLMGLLREWAAGFCPLNEIEHALSNLIDERETDSVERIIGEVSADEVISMLEPGDVLIDCTGTRSLLRDHLAPTFGEVEPEANTLNFLFEHALVITFLYSQNYECNEYCKYYKNAENQHYKFIPMVHRVSYDGNVSHVTGIVTITPEEFAAMPNKFDGEWLRANFPNVAESMDRFIDKIKAETHGELVGDLEIIRIPLNLYRARDATNRRWGKAGPRDHPFATTPVFLAGDSAIGSPYFQSISLGFECAMFLAGHIAQCRAEPADMLDRYELYIYKQWLRVYMQSKMIKHNKELFQTLDDPYALLEKLHIY